MDAVTILLIGLGLTWTEGRPSHSDTQSYLVMMVPGHDFPQENTHLRRVGSSLFVYVGYYC